MRNIAGSMDSYEEYCLLLKYSLHVLNVEYLYDTVHKPTPQILLNKCPKLVLLKDTWPLIPRQPR